MVESRETETNQLLVGRTHEPNTLSKLDKANPKAAERIRHLATLEPDWDGHGGHPVTQEAMRGTADLLLQIQDKTGDALADVFIAPLPDGSLEIEWDSRSGVELMLVIPPSGADIRYLLDIPNAAGELDESEGLLAIDSSLDELLAHFP